MKPTPSDWPRISSGLYYNDASKAIDWLCNAFGFEVRLKVESDGVVHHSELTFGGGLIMVGQVRKPDDKVRSYMTSPASIGGKCTQGLFIYVDDVEAHCARATAGGARVDTPPENHDYGEDHWTDRVYSCFDLEGHHWHFAQRLKGNS